MGERGRRTRRGETPVITADPRDGQAYFIFAKSLERTGKSEGAEAADNQARRYLQTYAKWQDEWQKSQTTSKLTLRLRDVLNLDDVTDLNHNIVVANAAPTEDLLFKARVKSGRPARHEEGMCRVSSVIHGGQTG